MSKGNVNVEDIDTVKEIIQKHNQNRHGKIDTVTTLKGLNF